MKSMSNVCKGSGSIRITFRYAPFYTLLHIAIKMLTSICLLIQLLATSEFINNILLIIQQKEATRSIFLPVVILGAVIVWDRINGILNKAVECKITNGLRKNFRNELILKCSRLNYSNLENTNTWDIILRVNKEPEQAVMRGLSSIEGLGGLAIQFIGILIMIGINAWGVGVLLIIISIPMFYFALKGGKAQYEADRKVSKDERYYEYISDILLNREFVDERSLFSTIHELSVKWSNLYQKVRKHRLVVEFHWYVKEKMGGIIVSCMVVVVALALMQNVVKGSLSVGLYIALVQGVAQMIGILTSEFTIHINSCTKSMEYFKDLTILFNFPETLDALALPGTDIETLHSLEFRDVTFRYPNTDKKVLNHMNFTIHEGRRYVIVGANGAGKTTIIKLITGLYTEYEGEILLNGNSLKKYNQSQLKGMISVLFQDFARYSISLYDNVAIGDIPNMDERDTEKRVTEALKQVGLETMVAGLSKGIKTPLGKLERDGQELSGGQWQRVAIARTLLSHATLHILDEPTAALDPLTESAIYSEFGNICEGFTTILISHRLGVTKLADEIFVIDQGKVSEQGTHQQLMEKQGMYKQMYESQRGWYQ